MIALAAATVVLAAAALGVRLYLSRAAENEMRPGEDATLAGFAGPVPGNGAIACPPGYCTAAGAIASPVFAVGVEQLTGYWAEMMADEPRWVPLAYENGALRQVVLQRSAVLHFPDVVTVEFVALGSARSGVAIYSRARYAAPISGSTGRASNAGLRS